jgi:hypothetical protein
LTNAHEGEGNDFNVRRAAQHLLILFRKPIQSEYGYLSNLEKEGQFSGQVFDEIPEQVCLRIVFTSALKN